MYKYIELEQQQGMITLWLNQPEKRNAFHNLMILEISDAVRRINEGKEDNIVLIRGRGEAFCAGADLNWMFTAFGLDGKTNLDECKNLSDCLLHLYQCKKTTIAVLHGAAFGGGIGLAAACDLVLCDSDTRFSLSELRLGLVASCISPFIVKRIGEGRTKDLVFTARQFNGKQAETYGLVTRSVPSAELESLVVEYVSMILKGAPKAREISKDLIHQVAEGNITIYDSEKTARLLADVRVSKEARERLEEFVAKKMLKR